jgi:hypothetical protein
MLNPFFLQGSKSEQNLIQDLVNEHLKIYGVDVYYLPRRYVTEKTVIKEVIESEFSNAFPIEAYLDTYEGYSGQGTILSKFGIQELDDLVLIISKERYENYIEPLIKNIPDIKLSDRPKEGDLIYFPLGDKLFEIKYVEHEKPFYQLQKNYVYELRCELFRYGDEIVDTSIDFIDDNTSEEGYIQTLQMVGFGSTASAITSIVNGGVTYVSVTNRGSGYTSAPSVIFSLPLQPVPPSIIPPNEKSRATGIATMISGIVDLCETDSNLLRVQGVNIINPGFGYTTPPMVNFIGGGGSGAEAKSYIGDGVVGIITVTDGGSGYSTPPLVTFSSPGIGTTALTITATGYALINSSGSVTGIYLTNSGLGYTVSPTITISSPQTIVGSGSYLFNETVVGSSSGVTARVKSWNIVKNILEVSNIDGIFTPGEILVGQKSGSNYLLKTVFTDNLSDNLSNDNYNGKDKYADNNQIEIESDLILDFSEKNPFGTP